MSDGWLGGYNAHVEIRRVSLQSAEGVYAVLSILGGKTVDEWRASLNDEIRQKLAELDGSQISAIAMLAGVPLERLAEFGAIPEES